MRHTFRLYAGEGWFVQLDGKDAGGPFPTEAEAKAAANGEPQALKAKASEPKTAKAEPKKAKAKASKPRAPKVSEPAPEPQALTVTGTSAERHAWLEDAAAFARDIVNAAGATLPEPVQVHDRLRVSVSWPFGTRKAIGQCWHAEASGDGSREVFISPALEDSVKIVGVLVHELCHASLDKEAKHGAPFKRLATACGLCGKMTATEEGPELTAAIQAWVKARGDYPCKALDPAGIGRKVQTSRLLKCECPTCGYVARITRQWIETAGLPICPIDDVSFEVAS
jgi:hypothetical protein